MNSQQEYQNHPGNNPVQEGIYRVLKPVRDKAADAAHRGAAWAVGEILNRTRGTVFDRRFLKRWQQQAGVSIIPANDDWGESPIPDVVKLEKSYPKWGDYPNIDMDPSGHRNLLNNVFPEYAQEYNQFPQEKPPPDRTEGPVYYRNNTPFTGIDADAAYCMVRYWQPGKILEIGSGFSTLVYAQAMRQNFQEGKESHLMTIDPFENPASKSFISTGASGVEVLKERAENLHPHYYADQLNKGDILSIDGSHVDKIGGDVPYLYLHVLPRLKSGVIIHAHDIYIPDEYPKHLPLKEHRFWTEQHLLAAILQGGGYDVLFGSQYALRDFYDQVKTAFPAALDSGASFWFRKK